MQKSTRTAGVVLLAAVAAYAPMTQKPIYAADPFASVPVSTGAGNAPEAQAAVPVELVTPPSALKSVLRPAAVAVSDFGTVTITVQEAPLADVLKMLAQQSQRNIITSKGVSGTVTASLYDVTLREALEAMLKTNGLGYREEGNFIYVYTEKELADLEAREKKQRTEVFRTFYTASADAVNMIKPVLSADAQVSFSAAAKSGLESGVTDMGGDSHATNDTIVVTDFPENLEKVRMVLKEIDRRPQQVLVEATIMRATLNEDNALGVDFNILAGVNFSELITGNGQISNARATDSSGSQTLPLGGPAGGIGTGNNFTSGITNGFRFGLVSDNVSVFISALEGVTDTTVLANPKILTLNKQRGEVIVGRKDGYLTTTVTESSTVQTVEFLDTGTRLIFRPYIGDDGYIRMEIHPEDSSGGLTANANLPFKITTEVTSNIMVKDGHTIVIGGLFRESSDSSRSQVPLLGSIPLAGQLFRNQRDRTTREEIVILLTPHIIKDDSAYAAESEQALKDAEKLRVGVRKGMMPWGRERMAESAYEQAMAELAKPEPDKSKAMWHLNIATNLNPRFLEAIRMKEQLSGEVVESVDNSSVKGFLRRRVMAEREMKPQDLPAAAPVITDEQKKADAEKAAAEAVVTPSLLDKPLAPKDIPTRSLPGSTEVVAQDAPVGGGWGGMFRSLFTGGKKKSPTTGETQTKPAVEEVVAGGISPSATADLTDDVPVLPVDPAPPQVTPVMVAPVKVEPAEGPSAPTSVPTVPVGPAVPATQPATRPSQPISLRSESQPAWGALKAAMEARKRKEAETKPAPVVVTVDPPEEVDAGKVKPEGAAAEATVQDLPDAP